MGSNPTGGMDIVCCECCVLSGRGLCDELITHPVESYRLWCVIVCDLEPRERGDPGPLGAVVPKTNKYLYHCKIWGILAILPLSHSFFRRVWPHQILFVSCPLLLSVFGLNFILIEDGNSADPQIIWQTGGLTERQYIYFEYFARILSIV